MTTNNKFSIECKISEAKARVQKHAETSKNFEDFMYDVKHDKAITSLVPARIVNVLIQHFAAELD